MSTREQVMQAVVTALTGLAGIVKRNPTGAIDVTGTGALIVRDGTPVVIEETMSADRTFYVELDVTVEVYAPGETALKRATRMDNLVTSVYTALETNAVLSSLVTHVSVTMTDAETLSLDGVEDTAACVLSARFEYDTASSTG